MSEADNEFAAVREIIPSVINGRIQLKRVPHAGGFRLLIFAGENRNLCQSNLITPRDIAALLTEEELLEAIEIQGQND